MKYDVWLKYRGFDRIRVDSDTEDNAQQHAIDIFYSKIVGDIDPEFVDVDIYEVE